MPSSGMTTCAQGKSEARTVAQSHFLFGSVALWAGRQSNTKTLNRRRILPHSSTGSIACACSMRTADSGRGCSHDCPCATAVDGSRRRLTAGRSTPRPSVGNRRRCIGFGSSSFGGGGRVADAADKLRILQLGPTCSNFSVQTPSSGFIGCICLNHVHLPRLMPRKLIISTSDLQTQLPCRPRCRLMRVVQHNRLLPASNARLKRNGDTSTRSRALFEANHQLHDAKCNAVACDDIRKHGVRQLRV